MKKKCLIRCGNHQLHISPLLSRPVTLVIKALQPSRSDVVYFSKGALSYLAPELLKEIRPSSSSSSSSGDHDNDTLPSYNHVTETNRYASISSYGRAFDSWLDDSLFTFESDTYAFGLVPTFRNCAFSVF